MVFIIKILFPYTFCLGNLLGGCFLSFLNYTVSGYHQCIAFGIPKCKQPVGYLIIKGTELPNVGVFKFFKNLNIAFPFWIRRILLPILLRTSLDRDFKKSRASWVNNSSKTGFSFINFK